MAKYPWDQIKAAYVEGIPGEGGIHYPTLEELTQRYGCKFGYLRQRAAKEKWTDQKNIYLTKIEQKKQEKKSDVLASRAAEFDAKCLEIVEVAVSHVKGHFLAAQERFRASRGQEAMNDERLERLSRTLERYQRAGRIALGESDSVPELLGNIVIRVRRDGRTEPE